MPPIRVRDKMTGRVDTIDWSGSRPPTRSEVLRLIQQKKGTTYRQGGNIPDDVSAPMSQPNAGRPSAFNRASSFMMGDKESSAGLSDLITGEFDDGPSTFQKVTGTMWGGEHSVLPPIRGITRPALPEIDSDAAVKRVTYKKNPVYDQFNPSGELEAGAESGAWAYNNLVVPSSSAIGAASDWITGKVVGPIVKPIGRYIGETASSIFGRGARAADEVLPPATKPAQKLLPERAASSSRYAVDEKGLTTDLTRPYSSLESRPFDPRTSRGPSGAIDPATGVVRQGRDAKGKFIKREVVPPPTVKTSELPDVDIPAEISSAYPRPLAPKRGELPSVPPPGLDDAAHMRALRENSGARLDNLRTQHQLSPTDARVRGGPTTAEYTGRPGVNPKAEGPVTRRWQIPRDRSPEKQAAIDRAANALREEARVNPSPKVKAAADEIKGFTTARSRPAQGSATAADMGKPLSAAEKRAMFDEVSAGSGKVPDDLFGGSSRIEKPDWFPSRKSDELADVGPPTEYKMGDELRGRSGMANEMSPTSANLRKSIFGSLSKWKAGNRKKGELSPGEEILNIPRSVMSSVDLSAPFRQGLGMVHKKEFWNALPDMVRSFSSEEFFKASQSGLKARPNFKKGEKAGLALSDLGKSRKREELFMSNYAEKAPILGRAIRASGRGYVTFLNKVRADVFDNLVKQAAQSGAKVDDKVLARFINTSTGRGNLGKTLERSVPLLNATLFSPRLMKSRVDMLNPYYYYKLDPFTRKEALKSLAAVGGSVTTVLGLASAGGADVEVDQRSSDFAKIKIGKVRLDIGGGFQQYLRLAAQIGPEALGGNRRKDLETGRVEKLGTGYRGKTRKDVLYTFMESKASPIASFMLTAAAGRTFTGEEAQFIPKEWKDVPKSEIFRRLTPMITQDLIDLYQEDPELLWMALPASLGASIQVHKKRTAKRAHQ